MGLFDFFRKKKVATHQETPKVDDFNPLNIDSVIGYVKVQKPDASAQEVANIITKLAEPEEDQEHLTPDGDLPWGWYTAHAEFTSKVDNEYNHYLDTWLKSRYSNPTEEYQALKSFIQYMEDTQKLCASKGECYEYWLTCCFDDKYISMRKADLEQLGNNLEVLTAEYNKKVAFERDVLPTLEKDLISIIKGNPGILQKDIYKMFDPVAKSYIQEKLYFFGKSGKITREKSGNTYKLSVK